MRTTWRPTRLQLLRRSLTIKQATVECGVEVPTVNYARRTDSAFDEAVVTAAQADRAPGSSGGRRGASATRGERAAPRRLPCAAHSRSAAAGREGSCGAEPRFRARPGSAVLPTACQGA